METRRLLLTSILLNSGTTSRPKVVSFTDGNRLCFYIRTQHNADSCLLTSGAAYSPKLDSNDAYVYRPCVHSLKKLEGGKELGRSKDC